MILIGFFARLSYSMARTPVLALFAKALGASSTMIGLVVGMSTVTGIFFKAPAGTLSDVFGRRAALLASVMSSCDSFMTATSGLFTQNIYRPLFPQSSQKTLLLVGRIASFAVVAGGVVFAYTVPGIVKALEIFWKMAAMMGIAFWLGLFWRRASVVGAWASVLSSFAAWWVSTQGFFIEAAARLPHLSGAPFVWGTGADAHLYLPWQMLFYLVVGTVVGVVVSLLTRPVAREKLDNFYALTRTPIVRGEEPGEPCTIPEGTETLPRRSLLPFASLEIPVPSLTSVAGFAIGWACVAALIGAFLLIAKG